MPVLSGADPARENLSHGFANRDSRDHDCPKNLDCDQDERHQDSATKNRQRQENDMTSVTAQLEDVILVPGQPTKEMIAAGRL